MIMPRGKTAQNSGKLRIIGGKWRSRLLPIIEQPGLRPTPDRVRETLFNWLQGIVPDAYCLDLFAGSGTLGFEAASRGARQVILVEQQNETCDILRKNIQILKADNIRLDQRDAIQWLQARGDHTLKFDLVFIDPPYSSDLLGECCGLLEDQQWLADEAYVYLELSSERQLDALPENWQVIRGKKAGQVSYHLVRRSEPGEE